MTTPTTEQRLLTYAEAADLLRVTERTVYRMVDDGRLLAVRLGTGRRASVRIDRDALEAWLYADDEGEAA